MLKIKPKCCLKPSFHQNQTPVWNTYSRTRHLSVTLIAESDTCLEHYMDSNNTYTNYSCGHPISVDPLHLPLPVTIHFRLNFDHFLPDPSPFPSSTGCNKCMVVLYAIFLYEDECIARFSYMHWCTFSLL